MSAFYVGGMYLNDAFDRGIDAIERPERPIPAGQISAREVFTIGFGLLGIGLAMLVALVLTAGGSWAAVGSGAGLGAAIVLYDAWHKKNPLSPFLMGLCRVLVYTTAALAMGGALTGTLIAGGAVLLGYLIGLTYVAKQENLTEFRRFWPLAFLAAPFVYAPVVGAINPAVIAIEAALIAWVARAILLLRARAKGGIPKAVGALIAGISLVDALLAAAQGNVTAAIVAALAFPATLLFHRWVAGT
jgi:4-hydroxybenzoate polyprenyltransferase